MWGNLMRPSLEHVRSQFHRFVRKSRNKIYIAQLNRVSHHNTTYRGFKKINSDAT